MTAPQSHIELHIEQEPRRRAGLRLAATLVVITLLFAQSALADTLQCAAVFPAGLQSHSNNGHIDFGWNAQLLNNTDANNPDTQLRAASVSHNAGSSLLSCGSALCQAGLAPSATLSLDYQDASGGANVQVPFNQSVTLGLGQSARFRNINVAAQGTVRFASRTDGYLISRINLAHAGHLELAPGDYWIDNLNLPSNGVITVTGEGTARLFVKNNLTIPSGMRINAPEGGGAGDASRLLIYGQGDIQLQFGAQVSALVYSRQTLRLGQAELHGAAAFANAHLEASAAVHHQPQAVANADLAAHCDDGPVAPPPPPPGPPGDGDCPAAWPNGLQTHAENGSIHFQHNAQLHNAADSQLHSAQVTGSAGSSQPGCADGDCSASGLPVSGLELDEFRVGESQVVHNLPWMASATLGEDGHDFQRLELAAMASATLIQRPEPYLIRELHLGYNTRLNLPAGDYWIEHLTLEAEARIQVQGQGTVRLYVNNPLLYFPWQSSLNANTTNPAQLVLYAYGAVDFHTASRAYALIYAQGQVALNYQAAITGGITASHINLGVESSVTFDAGAVTNANYGELCPDDDPPDDDPVEDPPDTTPPQLQVSNPDGQTVFSATLIVTGTAVDPPQPGSGMASVVITSDRFADVSFSATLHQDSFLAEVPLALGENQLLVTARDLSGNTTEVSRLIRRERALEIVDVSHQSGEVLDVDLVTLGGSILAPETAEDLRFYINEWQVTPTLDSATGFYRFNLPDLPLQTGENHFQLRATTGQQSVDYQLTLIYTPAGLDDIPPPALQLLSPLDGALLNERSFQIRGQVTSHGGPVQVSVNGSPVPPPTTGLNSYYFNALVSFPEGENLLTVTLEALDSLGKSAQLSASYHRDSQAPQILVHGLDPVPAVNEVVESPYLLRGTVVDDNLASLTANGQPLPVTPGSQPEHYDFEARIALGAGEEFELLLVARDISGNRTSASYALRSTATAGLLPLLPGENTELLARGEPIALQVAARVSGSGVDQVQVQAADALAELTLSGTLASGELLLPPDVGEYTLLYQALNSQGLVVASASRQVRVSDPDAGPLILLGHQPDNNARNQEAGQAIELQFNRVIDPSRLDIQVRETLHGDTYVDMGQPGEDFTQARGYELQRVSRSQEPVPGSLVLLPGNTSAAFYPERHYGFNARLQVDVLYDGEELGRFTFEVRPLPTFVTGTLTDLFGQPLHGVTVTLPGLNRETRTNANGGFAFGFGEPAERDLPGGRHRLLINPGFGAPGYGTLLRNINLQAGRYNDLGTLRLQELNPNAGFSLVSSGEPQVSLAGHQLQLDLSDARLLFPNNRTSGNVHVQFMPVEQIADPMADNARVSWVFATQPRGIAVEGRVGLTLQVPPLHGSHDYLLLETQYVVLVGYDQTLESLQVMGLGLLSNRQVTSVGKVPLNSLDYLGYVLMHPEWQPVLESLANSGQTDPTSLRVRLQP